MEKIEVTFPGGKQTEAKVRGFSILTDQPVSKGGEDKAPTPFELFLASLASCAGFYAMSFCKQRDISTEGLKLELDSEYDPEKGMISKVQMKLITPEDFPRKYESAIIKAMNQCAVKEHIHNPPEFITVVVE